MDRDLKVRRPGAGLGMMLGTKFSLLCVFLFVQSNSNTTFSLAALCEGGTRSQAATTFFCLLVLKKQKALHLHQSAPYEEIFATPGPMFYD